MWSLSELLELSNAGLEQLEIALPTGMVRDNRHEPREDVASRYLTGTDSFTRTFLPAARPSDPDCAAKMAAQVG